MSHLVALDEDQTALVETVGKIGDAYGHRYFADKGRTGDHLTELWKELGDGGFLGVSIPEEYGGGGQGVYELALVLEELASKGLPLFMGVISPGICGAIVNAHGGPDMKREWLPALASGEKVMAFAITESDAGTNTHNVVMNARLDGDEWVLNGSKTFISGADVSSAILTVARTGTNPVNGRALLTMFVVPTDAPGLQITEIPVELVSPERQYTLFFDDVRVPRSAMIGEQDKGLHQVFAGLNPERVLIASLSNGIGRYAVARATEYVKQREVWGVPIGAHQGVAHPIAETHINVELARLGTHRACRMLDAGEDPSSVAAISKFAAAEAALKALDQAVQSHGGNGLTSEYGLADLWFVARIMRIAPVSREMVLNHVSVHDLGLPRSY